MFKESDRVQATVNGMLNGRSMESIRPLLHAINTAITFEKPMHRPLKTQKKKKKKM